ncbi:Probable histone-lysine N-methyltransferase Mes-4 [Eumeta japonica]|uniref:Probable histone-lysine N-methyltransferase Mes-4 n=1 Tax=Eumeta variegata TaxID=151549 RepID=A0A4C1V726_EUMVA|nr:Probable histone-lysine N-methyltransferase Mes-4 [Eumeta japonica]
MNEWKLGDCAIAKISKKAYAKVQIIKCEDGTFWGNKVIGFEQNDDGSLNVVEKLCYFVQICRTGDSLWIPASALQLAERARPFYGQEKQAASASTESDKHDGPSLQWCLVCGTNEDLEKCIRCPASYHRYCAKQWFITMLHRKNLPKNIYDKMFALRKQLSSTRSIKVLKNNYSTSELCPSCQWGPSVGYGDIVWQKMKSCPWWPARILSPGSLPSCLVTNMGQNNEWPVLYYGTENYSWCNPDSVVLFLPQHADALLTNGKEDAKERRAAIMDACDDYVSVYLV